MPVVASDAPTDAIVVTAPTGRQCALRAVGQDEQLFVLDTTHLQPGERGTALLALCLVTGEMGARALTVGEREALLLHLRRLTIGERLDCVVRCPTAQCGEQMEVGTAVRDLLVGPYQDVRPSYELAFRDERASYAVSFRLPTADDLNAAAAAATALREADAGVDAILKSCVLAAEADGTAIGSPLPEVVRSAVSAAMAERDPQAEVELDLRCPTCQTRFTALFDAASFLLRELEDRAIRLVSDVNTLALHYNWSETEILRMPPQRRARYIELLSAQARNP